MQAVSFYIAQPPNDVVRILQHGYFIYNHLQDRSETGYKLVWTSYLQPQKTDQNRYEPVYDGSVRFF